MSRGSEQIVIAAIADILEQGAVDVARKTLAMAKVTLSAETYHSLLTKIDQAAA